VQKPHPPILMGGDGPKAIEGLLEYCDEWMPRPTGFEPPLPDRIAEVQRRADAAGRGRIPVTIFGAELRPSALESYERLGAACAMFRVAPKNFDTVPAALEGTMKIVREYRGG
jgi:alkanesulfonate monooxygenase SsuD/methylene tetrahydromethanopterin reductase-like flavin-dependent oxidoreductase (luciferase family)